MSARGKAAPAYGTGRSVSLKSGYVRLWMPGHVLAGKDGYVYEHRLVVWEAGLDPRGLEIHHKNEDKTDNRLANFSIETPGEHQRHHSVPGTLRKNQYGEFPILTPAERLERGRANARKYARQRRARLRLVNA